MSCSRTLYSKSKHPIHHLSLQCPMLIHSATTLLIIFPHFTSFKPSTLIHIHFCSYRLIKIIYIIIVTNSTSSSCNITTFLFIKIFFSDVTPSTHTTMDTFKASTLIYIHFVYSCFVKIFSILIVTTGTSCSCNVTTFLL